MIRYFCLLGLFILTSCAAISQPCSPATKDVVYVTKAGWHVSVGLPVGELGSKLAFYKKIFPEARAIMFGYGKKTFFTAPADTLSEYILGPVPGPAAIQVFGLNVTPLEAYPEGTLVLKLSPGGAEALSNYIWNDLSKDEAGKAYVIGPSHGPEGLFYQAESEYNPLHTCNTWAADALQAAGLPLSGDNVVFSGQAMGRAEDAAQSQCLSQPQ